MCTTDVAPFLSYQRTMDLLTQQALEFDKVTSYLAQFTSSALGKTYIERLSPTAERRQITAWLSEVSELKEIRALHGSLPIEGVQDIRELLSHTKIQGTILAPRELRQIYDTLRAGRAIKKFIGGIESSLYKRIQEKVEQIALLDPFEMAIRRAIDEEGEILDGASPSLKRIRKDLRQAKNKIQAWLQNFLQRQDYKSVIQDQVITLRKNRYVIPIKAPSQGKVKGIVHDRSASGVTVFIEPIETVELNNYIATLEVEEKQEIQRILLELTDLIREHRLVLEKTVTMLGELDFIHAKAKLSEKWACHQPQLRQDNCIRLLRARHPLLLIQHEHTSDQVVPIDVRIDPEYSALLITGPNTGGKTVSLKTIGLLTLMVQAGLHIPVDKDSEICIFHQVYADIGDQQSIEQNLSTFSSHISHIVKILQRVNDRSLVLLDELGAGTDPAEGASLGISILEYLDDVKSICVATTHHDALKSYAYTHPRTMNASVEFDVNTLSPTYHLVLGLPGKSNAFIIAERLGVSGHLIQRARDLMGEDLLRVEYLIRKLTTDSEEIEKKQQETDARYRGVLRLEKETDHLMMSARQERREILDKALEEAKQIVDRAIRQSQDVLQRLPIATREEGKQFLKTLHKEATHVRQKLKKRQQPLPDVAASPLTEIVIGGKVHVAKLNQTGTVLGMSKDGRQAELQVGAMRIEMPVNQLTPLHSSKTSSSMPKVSVSDRSVGMNDDHVVGAELVIIGKRVDEALEDVNKYLDQAYLSGRSFVSIVHGIGTGTLKKAVSTLLRSHPHVLNYALDEHNYGMTNVELIRK